MSKTTLYSLIIGLLISSLSFSQTTSDNFIFHYTNSDLISQDLVDEMETKFDNLDKTIYEVWNNINLLDRSSKIDVYLYDTDESYPSAPSDMRDWHVGYFSTSTNELHIKVPSTTRQLKYFPNLEKAAISILARYIVDKKRGSGLDDGRSFAFGLFASDYSPDVDLINTYLSNNSNSFPYGYSTFNTWTELDNETNVQLAYTYMFASIFRYGYIHATKWGGVCYGYESDGQGIWYQITRIFFLISLEDGGMRKLIDLNDFVIYSNSQEQADLSLEALQWYANQYDEYYGARINHPLLVAIYGSNETYRYAGEGNIDNPNGGGEARGHECLRTSPAAENLDTEENIILTKYARLIGHEFMHNVFAYLAETNPPSWLNEGAATFGDVGYIQGYSGINVNNMEGKHNFFWNENSMYFPDLDEIFEMDGDFGYRMGTSAFLFIKDRFPKETLLQFMKNANDFSIIGYANIDEFQLHLYEYLYQKYIPTFLFNPNWDLDHTFSSGENFTFTWDGHYINDLVLEYSSNDMETWSPIAEVSLANGSYSWIIPSDENCVLRFSDKKFPEINFTYQILGNKAAIGNVFKMTFENEATNEIDLGNDATGKNYVLYEPRSGGGKYAKFNGLWNAITVENYSNLNFSEDWTMQADFLIENTSGVMNTKPVLLEKLSLGYWAKNYSVSFNNNGANKLRFEYRLENNSTVSLEVDAGITNNTWYTFYFARSVENNIVEARVYGQDGTLLGSNSRELNGEGKVSTGAGDLYLGSGDFNYYERCLEGGLDNVVISDTYSENLLLNTFANVPFVSDIPDQTINEGANFTSISLDDFVSDTDNSDDEMIWTYTGNSDLSVVIDAGRMATITTPDANWSGSENITFEATDPNGYSGSSTTKFTVIPYDLVLISPNGGSFLTAGGTSPITWENTAVPTIKIEYSINNGSNWAEIVNNISASSMSYNWFVPNETSNQCLIKISDVSNASVFDISESVFEIGVANTAGGPYTTDENTVLLLHFDNNLDESSHNYTVNNQGIAKTYVTNSIAGLSEAIYFDNSLQANDSYITVPNSAGEMSLSSNWTIEFWFKFNSWNDSFNNWATPILLPTTGWDTNYYLEIPTSWERLKYGFTNSSGGSQILSSSNSITTGVWYHVALINNYDNNELKFVLHDSNFQLLEEQSTNYTSGTTSTGTQDLRIGAGLFTENHFDGYMDELRISNVVRSFDALGVQENILKDKYKLFPNPAKNILNINLPEKVDLSIYTITGQKVLAKKNIQSDLIDVSKLKPGLYIVLFKGKKGSISKKLIIE